MVVGNPPAQQGKIIQQPLGDEPAIAVQEQVGLRIALGQLLVALTHHERQVAELRGLLGNAQLNERLVEGELARSGRQQIFAAQHVCNPHERVIDRVNQRVERCAVGAGHHIIRLGLRLESQLSTHQVIPSPILVRHAEAPHRLSAFRLKGIDLLLGEVAVKVVVAKLRVASGCLVARLHFFIGGISRVDIAAILELLQDIGINIHALRLTVRLVRTTHIDAFIPAQAEPVQRINDGLEGLLGVTSGIGVLDAEDELAAGVAGIGPVEQRRADHAHVGRSCGRRAKTYADVGSCFSHVNHRSSALSYGTARPTWG